MDWASVAAVGCTAATGAGTVVWWLFRRQQSQADARDVKRDEAIEGAHKQIVALKDALADHKLHVAETYVPNTQMQKAIDAFNDAIKAVFAKLERIDDKLDAKADKK